MRVPSAAAVLFALAGLARAEPADAAKVRALRDEVFARPEFRYSELQTSESLFHRFVRWWSDLVSGLQQANPVLFWVVFSGLLLFVVVLVAHMAWTVVVARRGPRGPVDPTDLHEALRRLDPRPFRDAAAAHAKAGRFDEAVRDLYTAMLLALDRRGAVRFAAHKALLDYRLESARDPDAREVLARFAAAYPPGSFGRRPPRPATFEELLAEVDRLCGANP